ncbi:glutathione S-transferase [Cordyceps javanica]|uniref:Glutathione S-transferase n=1 Tax=Cordyceps javanica TaxID=43265 RepID=A0A545VGV7_9HYPO|nr:glutathione S-transferase [Cordyceps javanica]TQW12121.1 glutathione S-transferase [Cordyceps javanica]
MANATATLHYLDIGSLGRGEVVRLFLKDAGIDFKDVRYKYDDTWPATSKKLQQDGISLTGKVPALEYKGAIHVPTLRFLARDLGSYDGETSLEKYEVDHVADLYIDWRAEWVAQLSAKTDKYKNETVPEFYRLVAAHYAKNNGPYLLGSRITYADFAVFQAIDNDAKIGTLPAELPEAIVKFKAAFEARPRIAAYLKEREQK